MTELQRLYREEKDLDDAITSAMHTEAGPSARMFERMAEIQERISKLNPGK